MDCSEKKKILICDSQNFVSKIVKKNFGEQYDIERSAFFVPMVMYDDYENFLIYIIYNAEEFSLFKNIFNKRTITIVCVFNKKLTKEISQLKKGDSFFILDGSDKTKRDIVLEFNEFLKYSIHGHRESILSQNVSRKYNL
ncbi:hypothetical protein [Flavobacterium humidisoli]|uniref:Uncharacterized protein n=1 Tax=Flavobacterium humidisoli TaxID=2937442 RepID=A0ABY4LYK2_9FLAO|nr:hypothetical protein [Flavobacterium humidisoli]UPZ17867.1 hypothetical protein M0M44_11070 [Flavobacterium humidisoli]